MLKSGALTQTSTVWPALKLRCFFVSEVIAFAAPRETLPVLRLLVRNEHLGLPAHLICTLQPAGNCCVIWSTVSLSVLPLALHLVTTPDVSVGNGSAVPSQFSSIRLPLTSVAPGRIAALPSLQSWPAKNPSLSASIPDGPEAA